MYKQAATKSNATTAAISTNMIIAQLTDTHLYETGSDEPMARARAENLRAAVAAINALDEAPDAVIHTGDVTQTGAPGGYALAREIMADLPAPLYVVPGNRDSRANLRGAFAADGYLGGHGDGDAPVLFAIDHHAVRLVGFDTLSADTRRGDVDPGRLDWLARTLAERPAAPTAIFMHHPPVDIETSTYPWQFLRREAGAELAAVIGRHAQVLRVFCGHSHRPYLAPFAGAEASTVPSIAVDLRMEPEPDANGARPLVTIHRLDVEKRGFCSDVLSCAMRPGHEAMPTAGGGRKGLDEPPPPMR